MRVSTGVKVVVRSLIISVKKHPQWVKSHQILHLYLTVILAIMVKDICFTTRSVTFINYFLFTDFGSCFSHSGTNGMANLNLSLLFT